MAIPSLNANQSKTVKMAFLGNENKKNQPEEGVVSLSTSGAI
jgi:hypothetical protein